MTDSRKRLIEVAFPLKQTSLDSVHEKNVRHGHISTLHIWPARRPLAACRAALIATLLPDPGDPEERKMILEKLGGKIVKKTKRKKDAEGRMVDEIVEETEGGILHWGRENGPDLEWFRQKIREAYGGRAPRVLDPFAGGGAIPLEAMRLGCEATAGDINPVAWFILKCTLEYPQKLAGQTQPLPEFVLQDREFMEQFLKSRGLSGAVLENQLKKLGLSQAKTISPELPFGEFGVKESASHYQSGLDLSADLAWHVRAWGRWVLKEARKELASYYPTYADFEPLVEVIGQVEKRPMTLVPLTIDGVADIDALNAEFSPEYLAEKRNPRWVAKPTVAYLWARTVTCKNCRATIPLLKTRWLSKNVKNRVVLSMECNNERTGINFGVENDVPISGKNGAERREFDKRVSMGTMSRSGATCPCCGGIMTTEDIKFEARAHRLGSVNTAVALEGRLGKEFRLPTELEMALISKSEQELNLKSKDLIFGLPRENIVDDAKRNCWCIDYGLTTWDTLFLERQLLSILVFVNIIRRFREFKYFYSENYWSEAINSYLVNILGRTINYLSSICIWESSATEVKQTFLRFALPLTWDFAEANPLAPIDRFVNGAISNTARALDNLLLASNNKPKPKVLNQSALKSHEEKFDLVFTDPPYYDAVAYANIMDFFYVWQRRALWGLTKEIDNVFTNPSTIKWDEDRRDGELVDDAKRYNGDRLKSKLAYEEGMYKAFQISFASLENDGRLVIVFANKQPDAWETLVTAIIRAGFVVDGSWPIMTEMRGGIRNLNRASLSSSVWLICKKRNPTTRPGWDNKVLDEMRTNIHTQLRNFWDAGIRGPDFVWAATGPAMEAYSQYPVVKKANNPGELMTVGEFLVQVRRMVVDFVVGRVLSGDGDEEITGLDSVTTYYLLHRHDFGLNDAPAGPCILYAVSCGLSDKDLADRYDLLARRGGKDQEEPEETDEESGEAEEEGSGSSFRIKAWNQRKNPRMGYDPATDGSVEKLPLFPDLERDVHPSREIPLIDQVHRLMHLWKSGDLSKVNDYLDLRGTRRNPLFHQLLQALIELASAGSEERSLMESISNHVGGKQSTMQQLF